MPASSATARPRSPTSSSSMKARMACWGRTTWSPRNTRDLQKDQQLDFDRTPPAGSASPTSTGRRPFCPSPARRSMRASRWTKHRHARRLPDQLRRDDAGHRRRRAPRPSNESYLFAGAKEDAVIDAYDRRVWLRPARAADRLGLAALHHQADVLPADRSSTASSAISASPSWP